MPPSTGSAADGPIPYFAKLDTPLRTVALDARPRPPATLTHNINTTDIGRVAARRRGERYRRGCVHAPGCAFAGRRAMGWLGFATGGAEEARPSPKSRSPKARRARRGARRQRCACRRAPAPHAGAPPPAAARPVRALIKPVGFNVSIDDHSVRSVAQCVPLPRLHRPRRPPYVTPSPCLPLAGSAAAAARSQRH